MVSRWSSTKLLIQSELFDLLTLFSIRSLNVTFSGNLYLLDFVKPICLPYEDDVDENYEEFEKEAKSFHKLWVAGWGATTARGISDIIIHLAYIFYIFPAGYESAAYIVNYHS